MNDQTFHTPSFGDEDFEIPTMNAHLQHGGGHHQMDVHQYKMHGNGPPQHNMAMMNEQQYNQWHPDQQQQQQQSQMVIRNNSAYQMQSPSHSVYTVPSPNNSQQQQQMLLMQPPQRSPQMQSQISPQIGATGSYVGRSPPQSGQTPSTENGTSDDSDDNAAIPTNTLKRPSPEPYGNDSPNGSNQTVPNIKNVVAPPAKKPKVTKKKKKRDPNEPQKPVSAYALFFRDTQAAIKGQNPNASFGEVSKIVASMWDVLATEHKNVYKKKTEAAKKEYLKALSEYRAGLVSKGAESDQSQPMYSPPPQQQQQQQPPQNQVHIAQHPQRTSPQRMSPGVVPISHSPHLPMQGAQMSQNSYQQSYQQPAYKSPQQIMQMQQQQQQHHNSHGQQSPQMMGHPMSAMMGQMNPPQQQQMGNQNMNGLMGGQQHQQYMNQQIHPQQQQQQQHHMMSGQMSPQAVPPMSGSPPSQTQPSQCIRHGCPNPAIVNSDWEDEYCSNECVITHCRDVFGNWVQTNNTQQHTYSAVK